MCFNVSASNGILSWSSSPQLHLHLHKSKTEGKTWTRVSYYNSLIRLLPSSAIRCISLIFHFFEKEKQCEASSLCEHNNRVVMGKKLSWKTSGSTMNKSEKYGKIKIAVQKVFHFNYVYQRKLLRPAPAISCSFFIFVLSSSLLLLFLCLLFNTTQKMQAIKTLMRKVQSFIFPIEFPLIAEQNFIRRDYRNEICMSAIANSFFGENFICSCWWRWWKMVSGHDNCINVWIR